MTSYPSSRRLPRTLGLVRSIAVVVGITIGTGIFRSPAGVAREVPNAALTLGVWAAGGLITLCGALSLAELASALPKSGGFYAFLRAGWGPRAAFLFGWAELVLIRASALGGIALVFGEYLMRSFGADPLANAGTARTISMAAIALAAAANIVGARVGATIVTVSTAGKVFALVFLIVAIFVLGPAHGGTFAHFTSSSSVGAGHLGLALVSVLWAYDGFADLSFVGGEVRDPQRTLPRAIITGTLSLILIYLLANVAYLFALPIETLQQSPLVAADSTMVLLGPAGVVLVSALVALSSFSSLNGTMLAAPRIFFAMGQDGLLFRQAARVHRRFETPYVAIVMAAVLGIALVASRTFEALTNTFVLAVWPFYAASVAALYRLRSRNLVAPGGYRVPGYPVVPAIFIVSVAGFVLNALINEPISTGATFALILLGVPVYQLVSKRGAAPPRGDEDQMSERD